MLFRTRTFLLISLFAVALLPLKGVGQTPVPTTSAVNETRAVDLLPIPQPDLAGLEPAVSEQLGVA